MPYRNCTIAILILQGLYLYNSTLAVLSVQQQTIHILHIHENGKLQDVRSIGILHQRLLYYIVYLDVGEVKFWLEYPNLSSLGDDIL